MRRPAVLLPLLAWASACAPALDKRAPGGAAPGADSRPGGGDTGSDGSDGGDGGAGCRSLVLSTDALRWSEGMLGAAAEQRLELRNPCETGERLRLGIQFAGPPTFAVRSPADITVVELAPGAVLPLVIAHTPDGYAPDEATLTVADARGLLDTKTVVLFAETAGDQDGDGSDALAAGGGDCDDTDPAVSPTAGDTRDDDQDDDCDGLVDEDLVLPGDVLITEIFHQPTGSDPLLGQWLELENIADVPVDLGGWTLGNAAGATVVLPAALSLDPGDRRLVAASGDPAANGGVAAAATWGPDFALDTAADALWLAAGDRTIAAVAYDESWPHRAGHALRLDGASLDPAHAADGAFWCPATRVFGAGDHGSPGDDNGLCATVDHDLDGASAEEGDCDDADPTVSPGARDAWDGIDNNCDGLADGLTTDAAQGWLIGDAGDQLGHADGLSAGDLDGDGVAELLLGGTTASAGASQGGVVYAVAASALAGGRGGRASGVDLATLAGASAVGTLGVLPVQLPDLDGDGGVDLLVAGAAYTGAYTGGTAALVVYSGGVAGTMDEDDADIVFSNSRAYVGSTATNTVAALDMDGDGLDDVALGVPTTYTSGSASGRYYEGMATVYPGATLAPGDTPSEDDAALTVGGTASSDRLGGGLGGGDLDGDGYDELVVGAGGADTAAANGGAVYVIPGGAVLSGDDTGAALATLTIGGAGASDGLGAHAAPQVADLDGDGAADLVTSSTRDGAVFVFFSAGGLSGALTSTDADLQIDGDGPEAFGYALHTADVDGDGTPELLVGAPDGDTLSTASGSAFSTDGEVSIFTGTLLASAATLDSSDASFTLRARTNDAFGAAITTADTDGDGDAEVIVAAPGVPGTVSGVATTPAGSIWAFDPH